MSDDEIIESIAQVAFDRWEKTETVEERVKAFVISKCEEKTPDMIYCGVMCLFRVMLPSEKVYIAMVYEVPPVLGGMAFHAFYAVRERDRDLEILDMQMFDKKMKPDAWSNAIDSACNLGIKSDQMFQEWIAKVASVSKEGEKES